MQQIVFFFIRNKNFLLFALLFLISVALTLQSHTYHQNKFVHSANFLTGGVYSVKSSITGYFDLKEQNEVLIEENNRLRALITQLQETEDRTIDTSETNAIQYRFVDARVINNYYSRTKNRLTLNKGANDSIRIDMGVITSNGIVGIVSNTSGNYASVQSVLNTSSQISAKTKRTGHLGNLKWNAEDPAVVQLEDIPRIAQVRLGDTIVTSGRSTIFPEGIGIGAVSNFKLDDGDNYYDISVRLFNDMTSLNHVYVIENIAAEEIKQLESESDDAE